MSYQPKTYRDNGGDRHVIAPGGTLLIEGAVRGLTPGTDWFVDSVNGSAGNDGLSWASALLTIQAASTAATANAGHRVFVAPGHVETISAAAGLALATAGIEIIFVGNGNDRGRIVFGTVVGADVDVDAADVTMVNPRFVAAVDALTGPIDVNAARFKIVDGTCQDGTTINTTDWVVADANADDLDIDGLTFVDGDAGGTQKQSFIQVAAATRPRLRRIRATGDFGTGVIENGTAWVDALLDDVVVENTAAGPVVGILLQGTSSGTARKVHVRVASGTTYVTADNDMQWFDCYGVGTDGQGGDQIGAVPSASIEGKIDTLQAEVSGAAGLASFPVAAAPADTVSLAEVLRSVWAALQGTAAGENGITTWPAAAAPANTVSLAEAVRWIVENLIGTITNTGGTATIGAILGDMLNVDLATKLGAADGATTESLHGKLGTDTELADRSLYDQINGAGPAAAAAAAAPANDVSLYAAVRYIVETLIGGADAPTTDLIHGKLGTDTELADRSLYDLLNGGGPAAAAAAAAPANDVALYGVLREVYNQAEKAISTAAAVMANGDTTVFTIAGGPIEVLGLLSVCVTLNDATASTLQYQADPTDGGVTALSLASASLANAAAGTTALCTGTFGAALTVTTAGTVAAGTTKFVVPAGIIKITVGTGPTTGTWTHHLRYRPLARGVTVS